MPRPELALASEGVRLVELPPVRLGPFVVDHLPASGLLLALTFLLSLSVSVRLARRFEVPGSAVIEAHVAAVPVALLAAFAPALVHAWSAILRHPSALAVLLQARPSGPAAVAGIAAVVALAGWVAGRPWPLWLDVLAPGASLLAAAVLLAEPLDRGARLGLLSPAVPAAALVACAGGLALAAAWRGAGRGHAALLAAEGGAVALATEELAGGFGTSEPAFLAAAACLVALLLAHLLVVRRQAGTERA